MNRFIAILFGLALLWGCTGDQGPAGPTGPEGPEGPPGDGARIVYEGETIIPESPNPYVVSVPEVSLGDMPQVAVYVGGQDRWFVLPFQGLNYEIGEGEVRLVDCGGWYYKIVVTT